MMGQPLFLDDRNMMSQTSLRRFDVIFLYTIAVLVAFLILWASLARLDEITRAQGEVIPSLHAQVVQSLEGGILEELLVREGSSVTKGQVLMRLSDIAFAAEEHGTEAKQTALLLKKQRLEAEAADTVFTPDTGLAAKATSLAKNELALYASRQQELKNALSITENKTESLAAQIRDTQEQISKFTQSSALIGKELAITSKMVAQKAVPEIEELRLRRELNDAAGSLRSAQEQRKALEADLKSARDQTKDQRDKFHSQALGELSEVQTQIKALEENLKTLGDRTARAEIKSPVDGVVNNIAITTIGGVVEPAMKLAEIVPLGDDLIIRAHVAPSDIAFLKPGQKARVKFSAYDSARYGDLEGELIRIGAGSKLDKDGASYFEIEVRTLKNHLGSDAHPLPITTGMMADVHVITGDKSVLEYLMKPFLRLKDRALTER
ncbi:MAG: HlyD family type I secretion periplasmic adaptor subunit [Pseudobdellovibrionaceae bacterium]